MEADHFALFTQAWPEPVLLVTASGRIVEENAAAATQLGNGGGTLAGSDLGAQVVNSPEDVRAFLDKCRRTRSLVPGALTWRSGQADSEGGRAFRAEGTLLSPGEEGKEALLMLRLRPKDSADRRFQALNERIADLSREVNARREAEQALVQSRAHLAFILDSTGVGLWFAPLPFGILDWDARTRELLFLPEGEEPTIELFYERLHPDDREPTREAVDLALATGEPYDIDHRVVDPASGKVRWLGTSGMASFDEEGSPVRLDGVTYDITERKEREAELRALASQLEEADRRKDVFLATLAHELRNPLAPLRTGVEILRMKGDDEETVRSLQSTMERQIKQLTVLVNDLLDVSRSTRGTMEIRPEVVPLEEVVRDAAEMSRPLIEGAGHKLNLDLPTEPVEFRADPFRLAQLISNLLNNAAKYTPRGKGEILLSARVENERVLIGVRDNGYGIPAAQLESIFDMFTQLPAERDRTNPGLGVGLTLVKLLVELHGGTVRAESAGENEGSTFEVELPRGLDRQPASS